MVGLISQGSLYRIRNCAVDLLSIMDLMDGDDSWDIMRRDLDLRSTFLYCDFNQMIFKASEDEKKSLIELANRLFYSIEELSYAVKIRNVVLTESRYLDTASILEELLVVLPYCRTLFDESSDDSD